MRDGGTIGSGPRLGLPQEAPRQEPGAASRSLGWLGALRGVARALGQMVYGASIHEMVRDLNRERGMIERLFILAVFGDVLGVPLLPPYYSLRLLPYVVPKLEGWRYSLLRERDLTDLCDQEFT